MAWEPKGYTYPASPNGTLQYQRFPEEYFSGADTRIYFGDRWVDEITNLSFSLVENVQPIFGYASFTYDAVARGNRQIQGQFSINFKESYYLHSVMNSLELKKREQEQAGTTNVGNAQTVKKAITIEHLLSKGSVDSETAFEEYASMFEQSLWGKTETGSSMTNLTNTRGDQSYFAPASNREYVGRDGFNIVVLYGAYGDTAPTYNTSEDHAKTAHSLVGVHITGVSQVVDNSGQPIQEIYSFIAKDMDWNINLKG